MIKTIFIAAVLAAAIALSVIATPLIYAQDTSEPSTDQSMKQKNTGSGESTNFNCGNNLIKAGVDEQECEHDRGEAEVTLDAIEATEIDDAAATETEP
jgi:hypothetical protein